MSVGQSVYVIPYLACGHCVACRRGKTNCCVKIGVLGVHLDGGMADYVCVPEANLALAGGVTLDEAEMVEFLAIGAHAVRRADPAEGDRVLVVGAGPIGLACMNFAKLRKSSLTALDLRQDRLDFAKAKLGAECGIIVDRRTREALAEATSGDFFDVVIDATGATRSMTTSFGYVAHGGKYVIVSVVNDTITFSDPEFHKRETTLLGSRNATREDFSMVIETIRQGLVPTDALATHRATLEEAPARFPLWMKPEAGVIKAIIEI